ncbi:MAG: S8 family peptidase [Candidatus Binatia bacterium]
MTERKTSACIAGLLLSVGMALGGVVSGAEKLKRNDPLYLSRGSWQQKYDDQWALKRVGFTPRGNGASAWDLVAEDIQPVIVAVIDSGLDYLHPDLNPENVWRNSKEIPNGRDDDGNGYIDDLIGWNFVDGGNNPWDNVGHGTHVAGIVAAATGNGEGIAGINPRVKIMPLKILNSLGRGRATRLAEAIFYAVKHRARVINLSIGEKGISQTERLAIEYAHKQGVVVVVAAGNVGSNTADYGPAGLKNSLTVAATDVEDKRLGFSNWGQFVRIAAPGQDVLSFRAGRTDLGLVLGGKDYKPGSAFVGPDSRYFRATGTSFAAPFVAGVASLLIGKNPKLTKLQVERMLLMSADDIDSPGWDQLTGYGRLNAKKALESDPEYYLYVELHRLVPTKESGRTVLQLFGTATGNRFGSYHIEVGQGEKPKQWRRAGRLAGGQVKDDLLGSLTFGDFGGSGKWTIRLVAQDSKQLTRESRTAIAVGR